jgi:hypothetical protein
MIAENKQETVEYDGKTPLKGKREKFAQLVATNTKNNTEAARGAGYKDNKGLRRYAHDLATNNNILARIAYLKAELAKKWDITKQSQVKEYIGIRDRAIDAGDLRAEISANNSIDKLCGLIVDKIETSEAQTARKVMTATEQRLFDEWMDNRLKQSLAVPEALEAVNEVVLDDV